MFMQLLLVSCEELYHPAIDAVSGQLVVDAKITNDPSKNIVHLSRTRHFYDDQPVLEVTGATVSLVEMGGTIIKGYESATGYYSFNSVPEVGKKYFLRIVIQGVTYESRAVTMPPIPTLSDFYTNHVMRLVNENSGESTPRTYERPFREVAADIPLTQESSYYRMEYRSLLEWILQPGGKPSIFPGAYVWMSFQNKEKFNLIGPKEQTEPGKIIRYPLFTLSYDPFNSAHYDTMVVKGWILFVEQYGTSKESYDYHSQLNSQFAATGSLFDPIQTQVYGNILCKSNPLEKVYGYFDLNSVKEYRYFLILNLPPGIITLRKLENYTEIPDHGTVTWKDGDPPLKPSWWQE